MGKTFKLVVFFLFLVIIGLSGALWHQLQRTQQEVDKLNKHFTSLSDTQKSSQTLLTQQVASLTQKLTDQQNAFSQTSSQLSELLKRAPGDDSSWKVSEVIYLVRMANLQLTVQHNVADALVLLKQAENRLSTLHDPALGSFHAQLLKNISVLQNSPITDIDTMITELSNLREQVPTLSILVAPKPNTSILENTEHLAHKKWWQRAWDNVKASLKQLVIITHQDAEIPALMTPDQQTYLQQNLQLLIMQAQWALINHDADLYQSSLKQAKSWIEKFYVQNSASTQAFLKQTQSLLKQNIAPLALDLTQTLSLVHEEN